MNIKDLELTEHDFKLIIEGLDALPERGAVGEMLGTVIEGLMDERNPAFKERWKRELADRKRKEELIKEALREEVKILQGKLLMFKRYLMENNALAQVSEILKPKI
jgi:hypothetical protein